MWVIFLTTNTRFYFFPWRFFFNSQIRLRLRIVWLKVVLTAYSLSGLRSKFMPVWYEDLRWNPSSKGFLRRVSDTSDAVLRRFFAYKPTQHVWVIKNAAQNWHGYDDFRLPGIQQSNFWWVEVTKYPKCLANDTLIIQEHPNNTSVTC